MVATCRGVGFANGAGGDFGGCCGADSLCHCVVAGERDCLGRSGERGTCCGSRGGDGKVLGCARNVQRIFDRRAFVGLLDFTISQPELNGFGTSSSSPSSAEAAPFLIVS